MVDYTWHLIKKKNRERERERVYVKKTKRETGRG
jgi:hypothetical protein